MANAPSALAHGFALTGKKAIMPGPPADSLGREAGLLPQMAWEIKGSGTDIFWVRALAQKVPFLSRLIEPTESL